MTRYAALAIALVAAAVGYVALLRRASEWDLPQERAFGGSAAADPKMQVYVEPIAVNAVADSIQVRVSVSLAGKPDETQPSVADHDYFILLGHDDTIERIKVQAHESAPLAMVDLDLEDGDISSYPMDAYRAALSVRVTEAPAAPGSPAVSVPLRADVWERVPGFRVQSRELPTGAEGGIHLGFDIHRGFAITFFVLAAYAAMAILGIGSLTIGILVFLGIRKPEATLLGALAGTVFALPALRNTLPGAAPLGVSADIFVFVWAELMAVAAIALLIFTWARSGPRP
jgi:hypothetical protein